MFCIMRTLHFVIVLAVSLVACNREPDISQSGQAGQVHGAERAHYGVVEPPLAVVVRKGDMVALRNAILHGGDVNSTDPIGRTPLHTACFYHRKDAVEILIANGANLNAKDMHGFTPLHAAVLAESSQLVTLLISKGAEVNAQTNDGLTPLHLAAAIGAYRLVTILVSHGADVNLRDQRGRIAQAYALDNSHIQTAALLQKSSIH